MPHFVSLVRYTQQGLSKIKDSPARFDASKKAAEAQGGKILAWYLTMGQYDAVLISEFPSDEACAKFALSVGSLGNVSTATVKAFPEAEYRKIIGSLRFSDGRSTSWPPDVWAVFLLRLRRPRVFGCEQTDPQGISPFAFSAP